MGRLTEQDEQGNWCVKGLPWKDTYAGQVITENTNQKIYGALCKLKDYENSGLDPEEAYRLKEKMDEENNQIDLEYYDLRGGTYHIYMSPGNVQWICNILFNTERMFDDFINDPPDWAKDVVGWDWEMQIKCDRIHKIRMQIEEGLGYSTEKHWEKCLKKRSKKKKDNDVGSDALELVFKRAVEKKNEVPKEPTAEELNKIHPDRGGSHDN